MTQERFAHELAATVSTVNRWENGHANPSNLAWKAMSDLGSRHELPELLLQELKSPYGP